MVFTKRQLLSVAMLMIGLVMIYAGTILRGDIISMFLIVIGAAIAAGGALKMFLMIFYKEPERLDQYVETPASEKMELSDMKQLYLQGSGMMRISNRPKKR